MAMIRDILLYLDRSYIKDGRESVFDLGLSLFRDVVIYHPGVQEYLRDTLLAMIRIERNGDVVDHSMLRATCYMLVTLGVNSRRVYEQVSFLCVVVDGSWHEHFV